MAASEVRVSVGGYFRGRVFIVSPWALPWGLRPRKCTSFFLCVPIEKIAGVSECGYWA